MSRSDDDARYERKQRILRETGARRFALVPATAEDLAELAGRSKFTVEELDAMSDLDLGLIACDYNFYFPEISLDPDEPMVKRAK
jgi:hypothetical protein